ncbi:hypothetical protein V5F29_11005 [Xanthobacter aminoxidans]|uniref:hypothetical protein n=1 Tax=Xanthobacter aminoxidans TaxID=186280 RepID=UPI00372AC9E4
MSWVESWIALSGLIKGLQEAGELYSRFMGYHNEDSYGAGKYLREQCETAVVELERFRQEFTKSLPNGATERIDKFLASKPAQAAKDVSGEQRSARGALVGLVAIEAELTFILYGRNEQIRARSDRAFLLLQRTLAVDAGVKEKWQIAFEKGEVECERLGSLALLSQGIYAFKVDAAGARTDLVFSEPPDESLLFRSVDGLVLTEWKVADAKSASARFCEARKQADLYKQGPLAGVELTGYRYLVVVSLKALPITSIPVDETSPDGITYRHVNIVAEPDVPSKASKKA